MPRRTTSAFHAAAPALLLACCAAVLAACAGQGSGAPSSYPSGGVAPEVEPVVEAALADLEARPHAGDEPVRVVVARRETFPDGAIGCPEPGRMYTQALVEGYRVVLARGDRAWLYTAGEDGVPRLCASEESDGGRDFVPPPGKRD